MDGEATRLYLVTCLVSTQVDLQWFAWKWNGRFFSMAKAAGFVFFPIRPAKLDDMATVVWLCLRCCHLKRLLGLAKCGEKWEDQESWPEIFEHCDCINILRMEADRVVGNTRNVLKDMAWLWLCEFIALFHWKLVYNNISQLFSAAEPEWPCDRDGSTKSFSTKLSTRDVCISNCVCHANITLLSEARTISGNRLVPWLPCPFCLCQNVAPNRNANVSTTETNQYHLISTSQQPAWCYNKITWNWGN